MVGPNSDKNTRQSTAMFGIRNTLAITSKEKDPRPLNDQAYRAECITKIINYLITHNYDSLISNKILEKLNQKDFLQVFVFLLKNFLPDYNFPLKKFDEDLPKVLIEIRYICFY